MDLHGTGADRIGGREQPPAPRRLRRPLRLQVVWVLQPDNPLGCAVAIHVQQDLRIRVIRRQARAPGVDGEFDPARPASAPAPTRSGGHDPCAEGVDIRSGADIALGTVLRQQREELDPARLPARVVYRPQLRVPARLPIIEDIRHHAHAGRRAAEEVDRHPDDIAAGQRLIAGADLRDDNPGVVFAFMQPVVAVRSARAVRQAVRRQGRAVGRHREPHGGALTRLQIDDPVVDQVDDTARLARRPLDGGPVATRRRAKVGHRVVREIRNAPSAVERFETGFDLRLSAIVDKERPIARGAPDIQTARTGPRQGRPHPGTIVRVPHLRMRAVDQERRDLLRAERPRSTGPDRRAQQPVAPEALDHDSRTTGDHRRRHRRAGLRDGARARPDGRGADRGARR